MELNPNLYRIGNDIVAIHLIATPEGLTLIDAGLPGHYRDLEAELDRLGRRKDEIRGIVLTHGDSDHIGFAERLRAELSIPVYVHSADAARARGEEKTKPAWGKVKIGPTTSFLAYGMRKGALRATALTQVEPVEDGAVLPLPGQPRVIGLPGHSPGSIAVHVPAVRAVFVGDGLTTRHVLNGATGPQPAPFTDDPAAAAASLDRLADLDVDWVIPGHGPAWRGGVSELIAEYRAAAAAR